MSTPVDQEPVERATRIVAATIFGWKPSMGGPGARGSYEQSREAVEALEAAGLLSPAQPEPAAWRYRWRKDDEWSYTADAEKIERLRRECDDRDGTLTNERRPSYVIEPLYAALSPVGRDA